MTIITIDMDDISKMSDHDLLITMHEQIKGIKADIKDLKDGTTATLTDHENRIRTTEAELSQYKGALIISQIVIVPIVLFLLYKIL